MQEREQGFYLNQAQRRGLLDYLECNRDHLCESGCAKFSIGSQGQYSSVIYKYSSDSCSRGNIPITVASAKYTEEHDNVCEKDCEEAERKYYNDRINGYRSSCSEIPETSRKIGNSKAKMDFPKTDTETLLILQEVVAAHGHGENGVVYLARGAEPKAVVESNSELAPDMEEDIFSDIETLKQSRAPRRNRSLERSITPDLDTFIDEIYGSTINENENEKSRESIARQVCDSIILNDKSCIKNDLKDGVCDNETEECSKRMLESKSHLSTAEYLSKFGKKKGGLGRRGPERNKIDYSLFSRPRIERRLSWEKRSESIHSKSKHDTPNGSGNDKDGYEFGVQSSFQPYSECYLEVDGVCYLETHQDEEDEMKREIERERYKDKIRDTEEQERRDGKVNKRQKKDSGKKMLDREWRSIQRIMKKGEFRSLDSMGRD